MTRWGPEVRGVYEEGIGEQSAEVFIVVSTQVTLCSGEEAMSSDPTPLGTLPEVKEVAGSPGLRRIPRQARSRARVASVIRALVDLVSDPDVDPADLTTADVAARAQLPIGSLYEYFEDMRAVVDATVDQMLQRHDELLMSCAASLPGTPQALVDVVFDSYARLYREEPGFLALRNSTLFHPTHRRWLNERVGAFVHLVARSGTELGSFAERADSVRRLELLFALGDTVIQEASRQAFRDGDEGAQQIADEGRAILKLAVDRLAA